MSDEYIKAPGRSALWTRAALNALIGAAAPTIVSNNDGEEEFDLDHDAIVADAMAIADRFERRCIERHAREQAEERGRKAHELAEAEEQVRRVGRYRVSTRLNLITDKYDEAILVVARVENGSVIFEPHPDVNIGKPSHASLWDVVGGEGFDPAPLGDADLPAIATDALPTVPGMADADALLRAAMAERGKAAG